MSFTLFFPIAFPALALAHFVALLSPGQDFFLIVGHAIRHKLKGSAYICFGIALGNAIYILIAILGWAHLRDNQQVFSTIEVCGALYLMWIGYQLMKNQAKPSLASNGEERIPSRLKQLVLGFNSALLNPKNALFYMSLMSVILGNDVTLLHQITCGVWMVLVVLLWDFLIAGVIAQPTVQKSLEKSIPIIEKIAGAILIMFGIGLFLQ
ncbi:LysE family translocator [Vibrio cincinnatiensis]|uniref:LysE family translocator n=1 Tax=Vibrio cincinnatiensis TaxID=675 RepID=UPI001EDF948D|nr:LysE family translocator [Vibrio cincinnatiensis]MCG3758378.1 LysE family translocator [Vibrio cincinnatiensis]MCG3762926.1 LysE family translocator [Vibrio cincinnatiensis]